MSNTSRVFEDSEGMRLEVLEPHSKTFHVFLDNIHLGNPQTHAFAGILVPKQDAQRFLTDLARAMGITVYFSQDPEPATTAVEVTDNRSFEWWEEGESNYTVSGDVGELLTANDLYALNDKWQALGLDSGGYGPNHQLQELITHGNAGGFVDYIGPSDWSFDSEASCFFAYVDDKTKAEDLAAWINAKRFLK